MLEEFIDGQRMEGRLDDLWEIGRTGNGGVTRLAYSVEETEAIEYVLDQLPDGYTVRTDDIGNVFATRHPDAEESLYLGSHLDTVFNGGRLDGTLGVVTALEAIEAVHKSDFQPEFPPTLAIFRAEESSRFGQHTIGSRGALGLLTVEDFSAVDQSTVPLWQAMQRAGFQPVDLTEATLDTESVAGFIELHIEQGRVLDEGDENVGIVTSIRAPVRYRVTVRGSYDHSGATPMGLRRDALVGAAEAVTAIEAIGIDAAEDGDLVATVGELTAVEGAINKVCGEARFPIDLRSNDGEYRDEIEERILKRVRAIAEERSLESEIELIDRSDPVDLDDGVIKILTAAAETTDVPYRLLPSGGGHDAMNFRSVGIPTGMVFTPSVDGVSHNPAEDTPTEAIVEATTVLGRTIVEYDGRMNQGGRSTAAADD